MDPVLAALVVLTVALCLVTFVLLRRLSALSARLAALDRLGELATRLDRLADEVAQRQLGARLQARLTEFGEAMDRLSAAVAERRGQPPAAAPGEAAVLDLGGLVRRHLAQRGFETVHLLTDLADAAGLDGKVAFEARRRGVLHKGQLTVSGGVVVDEAIRSAYSAFP